MSFIPIKLKRIIKEGALDFYHFGFQVMVAKLYWIITNESQKSILYRNQVLLQWLEKHYGYVIKKYWKINMEEEPIEMSLSPVWVLWWQGNDNMPEIIQLCHKSKQKAAGEHPVILLTKDNVREYVDFPECVWEQFESKKLKMQHLADMIRVQLIQRYGGIWLDASIYCVKELPKSVFERNVFSLKTEQDKRYVSEGRWTTFAIGGRKGQLLFAFLNEFFIEYCKSEKPFVDYFMFDCAIALAYNHLPEVKKEIDELPLSEDCYLLNNMLKHSDYEIEDIKKCSCIQKLAWQGMVDTLPPNNELYLYMQKRIDENE